MAQVAGQMQAGTGNGDDWLTADGGYISRQVYPDYHRRVGGREGRHGITWERLPHNPGWQVCVRDDPDAPDPGGPVAGTAPPPRILIAPLAPAYHFIPPAAVASVRVLGTVTPPDTAVEGALVTDGATGAWQAVPADTSGAIDLSFDVPAAESLYQVRVRAVDFPGADQISAEFVVTPQPVTVTLDWMPPSVPQGTYATGGQVDPPDTALECALVRWDYSETPQTVTVDGGRFEASIYMDQIGAPCRLEFRAAAAPAVTIAASSDFAVAPAIAISAIAPVQTIDEGGGATVLLTGTFAGEAWETAEYQVNAGGVEYAFQPLPLAGGGFGQAVRLTPDDETFLRVRKVENPGIYADSNTFAVIAPPATQSTDPPAPQTAAGADEAPTLIMPGSTRRRR